MLELVKCRKCRRILLDKRQCQFLLLNAHNIEIDENTDCSTITDGTLLFLSEDNLPDWIKESVEKDNWMKGKLTCSQCSGRIGSFDFISGIKCACEKFVLPSVHIIKSKVDVITT